MNYHVVHFDEIDSTNNYLKNSYKLLNDFTFVTADYQSKGKGRNDRVWSSNKGENLMFSFLIKNPALLRKYGALSLITAIEVAKLLEAYNFKEVRIKWPNDVYINDKKVCGILLEGQILEYLVIGVGLNVNQKIFPDDLRRPATSLSLEMNKSFDIKVIEKELFSNIVNDYVSLNEKPFLEYFRNHNYLLNKRVRVLINDEPFIGEVVGIDDNFYLQIKTRDMLLHIDSGEIEIL
jgi:BirA family biotin operon repressor/biotin-[acetyl-CoA-carboxylase] ligase